MSKSEYSKLHIAMFPWVAYGHLIAFIHLSNKLAEKGHQISFLLPKELPPDWPSSAVRFRAEEAPIVLFKAEDFGSGLSFYGRIRTTIVESDAFAFRTILLLKKDHPNIGCFVNHCGYGTMWEFLLSYCQIVLIPEIGDQFLNTRLMVNELKIGVEVERGENRRVSKESLSQAIEFVMNDDNETANMLRANHAKLRQKLSNRDLQEEYISTISSKLCKILSKNSLKFQNKMDKSNVES
ncbi:UDP-glycosyltransferase 79B9 [Hibiscus syriacus]|uniref:UDP-glycosyltransferase 79B9 n=1 Tax=Hibiscus syriacus TaxID=106335 RepID=A0A6A3B9I3_HIBSY|nr:UDP-glycosyltransferase 79B9 [Hibiscus syriacus]